MLTRRILLSGMVSTSIIAKPAIVLAQQEVINIGWTGPLSGGGALYGRNTLAGLEIAAKEVNDSGGLRVGNRDYRINVIGLDDKYSASEAAVNAKRLRTQSRTPIVFCPTNGGCFAMQSFNEQDGFVIGAYTSVPQISERGNKLTFRIPPTFERYIAPFIKSAMNMSGKKLGMATNDNDYPKAWIALLKPAWIEAGGTIVADNPMSYSKDTDFYSGVSRVAAANPDVMFVGGPSEPTALVVKQARELGFRGGFIFLDQAKLDEIASVLGGYDQLENSVGVLPLAFDPRPGAKDFSDRYKKAYNKTAVSEISLNYSALNGFTEAMKLAGTPDDATRIFSALSEAFRKLPPGRNPASITSMDAKGGSNILPTMSVVKGGTLAAVDITTGSVMN